MSASVRQLEINRSLARKPFAETLHRFVFKLHDYPKEIDDIHAKLYPVLKKAKREKQQTFFKVDKLIINGQLYKGEETKCLPYYGIIMSSNTQADGEL